MMLWDKAKKVKSALRWHSDMCPDSKGNDIIHTLPLLHMSRRDWFDDEDYDDKSEELTVPRAEPIEVPLGVKY
jgi:hypothetical protein